MIDRVVLQRLDQIEQIVRFGDEDAVRRQQFDDAVGDAVDVADMREDIGRGDDLCRTALRPHLAGERRRRNSRPGSRCRACVPPRRRATDRCPSTRWPASLKLISSEPSFEPMSIDEIVGLQPAASADASR